MRRRLVRWLVIVALVAAGALLAGPVGAPAPAFDPRRLCLEVLDVGQGDALLLDLPGGERWLIDGGGDPAGRFDVGRYRLMPALRRAGVDRLDAVFATHGDADHVDGLRAVLADVPVDQLWIPGRRGASRRMSTLVDLAERRGVSVLEGEAGAAPSAAAPAAVRLLHPGPADGPPPADRNDRSIVLWVALADVSFLLTGDIEEPVERALLATTPSLRSTVLKVPHHASRTSSTPDFVDAVAPLVAVAGIGQDNRFGHPHASVARRYLTRGVPLYWTGRHGGLRACTDGFGLVVEQRGERGALTVLRRWTEQEVAGWSRVAGRPSAPGLRPTPAGSPEVRQRPPRRGRRRARSSPERTDDPVDAAPAEVLPPAATPDLIDEREWRRRRGRRGRLRAPW